MTSEVHLDLLQAYLWQMSLHFLDELADRSGLRIEMRKLFAFAGVEGFQPRT